jgi:hypothetical protein
VTTRPKFDSVGAGFLVAYLLPRLIGQKAITPTHAMAVKIRKTAGQRKRPATTGPVPCRMAKPTGALTVNVVTAIPCLVGPNERLTMLILVNQRSYDLSGQLDYRIPNHIEKWFQTVTMRIKRFHTSGGQSD